MPQNLPTIARIIVPLDGSDLAETALPVVVAIASASGAHIDLVTVALTYDVPLESQMDTLTRNALNKAQAELRARFPEVALSVLAGNPPDEIKKHAAQTGADLIVMATHGRSGLRKFLLGSVADRVISESEIPVLLVTDGGLEPGQPRSAAATFNRIVLPLDGGEATMAAVPYAIELSRLLAAKTVLLHVNESGDPGPVQRQIESVSAQFAEHGLAVETATVSGEPGPAISEFASSSEGTLVVMSSLSATGIAKGTHRGSVADYVIKHAKAPVLVVPPRGYLGPAVE